jgi:hypothetical protein
MNGVESVPLVQVLKRDLLREPGAIEQSHGFVSRPTLLLDQPFQLRHVSVIYRLHNGDMESASGERVPKTLSYYL